MGDPSRKRKRFSRPKKPWDETTLENERRLKKTFGLKNKRELWRTDALIRKKRQTARTLLAMTPEHRATSEKGLVNSLHRIGLLSKEAGVDDVLGLRTNELLERRLQTIVMRKGLANTSKQARQFIVHGHISVNGKKITSPAYLVQTSDSIAYYKKPMMIQQAPKRETKKEEQQPQEPVDTPSPADAPTDTTKTTGE